MEKGDELASTQRVDGSNLRQIENISESDLTFGFQINTSSLCDLFQDVALSLGFEMIQKEQLHSTAIKQIKRSFLHYIDCFNWVSDGNMTAIKMHIVLSQKNSTRICKIKGLVGSKKQVKMFIDTFRTKSTQLAKLYPNSFDQNEQNLDEPENPFHLQACAAYMFHKILSNQKYGIGNLMARSLKDYSFTFSNIQKSVEELPIPMKNATIIVKEIVDNLYKDFNLGRKEMQKVMPYCRITVQKYVFDRIQKVIYPIYKQKVSQKMSIFEQKRDKIFAVRKVKDVLDDINLQRQNWFFQEDFEANMQQSVDQILTKKQFRSAIKYRRGCEQLQKITHTTSPRQKIKHCQIAYSILKSIFYEANKKTKQLTNMEDIIPIFILVLLLSNIPQLKAQLDLIADFIQYDTCDLEAERRLLLNLSESFNYVYRDWKI